MRNVLGLGFLAAGLVLAAGSARAVPADFTASLSVEVSGFEAVVFQGEGTGETTPGGGFSIPQGAIVAGFVSQLDEALLGIIPGFSVCAPGYPGTTVFPIPANPGEQVPDCAPLDNGQLDEVVYDGVDEAIGGLLATAYLTNSADTPIVAIPLEIVGVGGEIQFNVLGTPATLTANPWTTGEVTVTGGLTGDPPTTFTDSGFDNRNPGTGLGDVKLVTTALASLGALGTVPTISRLNITFDAPEPSSTLLGVAAVASLAVLRRRARS